MTSLHVLFIPSWYPSCPDDLSGCFFREQAIALAETGTKVGVIAPALRTLRNPVTAFMASNRINMENDCGVHTHRASTPNLAPRMPTLRNRLLAALTNRMFASYIIDHGMPDVVHLHAALFVGPAAVTISESNSIPLVYSEHNSAYARNRVSLSGIVASKMVARHAVRRFAVSSPFATLLEQKFEMPTGSFEVMPNSVQSRFLDCKLAASAAKGVHFLHISLLDANKNVWLLLESFAKAFHGQPDIVLSIGGDGKTRKKLEQQANRLGISTQVKFLGNMSRKNVVAALSEADVFVLPSKFETFGVVVIEALAMGVPVIATCCGGPEDIIEPGDGVLVPVDDVDAMSNAMKQLAIPSSIEDRTARRKRCRQRFGSREIAERWLDIYDTAVNCKEAY